MGHPVVKLKRIRLFYLRLGNIPERAAVPLQAKQVDMLRVRCRKLSVPSAGKKGPEAEKVVSIDTRRQPAVARQKKRKKRTRRTA